MGTALSMSFDGRRYRSQFGGGPRKRFFNVHEIRGCVNEKGEELALRSTQYDLLSYVPLNKVPAELARYEGSMACKAPFTVILPHLTVPELKDVCRMHGILTSSRCLRHELLEKLKEHTCHDDCVLSIAILKACDTQGGSDRASLLDIEDPELVKTAALFSPDDLGDKLPNHLRCSANVLFKLVAITRQSAGDNNDDIVWVKDIPVSILVKRLTIRGIRSIADVHSFSIPAKWSKSECQAAFALHECIDCPSISFALSPVFPGQSLPSPKFLWESYVSIAKDSYPPRPTTMKDVASAMRGYCQGLSPETVEEAGCAVCGQLIKKKDLKDILDLDGKLDVLEETGATRCDRLNSSAAVTEIVGPVVVPNLDSVCSTCHEALLKGFRPRTALANHLWLGEVPSVLKDLTLAEQTIISRVRYNRCVVRVSSGHAKMIANVIAFAHPTVKIYERLPMSKPELEEVLAVVFTGIAPPTVDDLKRTPVLVRRNRVRDALEWLKLNNRCYGDLIIDYETLNTYDLEHVPVQVLHQRGPDNGNNVLETAMSQFDTELEQGTVSGPCPFTVHGLTTDRFTEMTSTQRKAAAVQHIMNGGPVLGVGHSEHPESIYKNPFLYPSMFPWLFPYGHGGVGQDIHAGKISKENHLRWLLMYHDKRFQEDAGFVIVSFNHQLIKQSSSGGFMLVKRNNFLKVAETMRNMSPGVLSRIAQRLKQGGRYVPVTNEEKQAFAILDQIEYVGGHVNGSLASKKYQRNELWSFVAFQGAPNWFLTLSPADNKHPLCIYMASHETTFTPEIKGYAERQHLVTRNPVACARFFHHVVQLFIKHICGWSDDGVKRGLFGKPSGFYGTVEQQGRMTLHLHFLLWIEGSMSPQVIRERLMGEDSAFEKDLITYLESCRVGEFLTGSMEEVSARVPMAKERKNLGIHTILDDMDEPNTPPGYEDPTLTLPSTPPQAICDALTDCTCPNCEAIEEWSAQFRQVVDDIVRRSNVHRCFGRRDNDESGHNGDKDKSQKLVPRQHATGKGCINRDGVCTARFPRDTYLNSMVELHSGHLNLKKREPDINDVTPAIVYALRCNTDTTCLLSGTAVKATLGYITDYITKGWLKTHQIFSTMYDTFSRNHAANPDSDDRKPGHAARRMIVRIVNSLSAKMEIGAPMAALYLLKNPDHYASHDFRVFYWKNYVNHVELEWRRLIDNGDPDLVGYQPTAGDREDVGVTRLDNLNPDILNLPEEDGDENVQMSKAGDRYVGKTSTDDYRFRPVEHDALNLYEWTQCSVKQSDECTRPPERTLVFYAYHPDHPQHHTHKVACDPDRQYFVVPNFVGPSLPRKDSADKEAYCCTMLTLFRPWRDALDLKSCHETWEEAFENNHFSERQLQIMENFNIRYECYDARDDFGAVFKAATTGAADGDADQSGDEGEPANYFEDALDDDLEFLPGPQAASLEMSNVQSRKALQMAGMRLPESSTHSVNDFALPRIAIHGNVTAFAWKQLIKAEQNRLWNQRFAALPAPDGFASRNLAVKNDAYIMPASYLTKQFVPSIPEWRSVIDRIAKDFTLNDEQNKAFKIVANHATCIVPDQLLMYLGGMGGTGKTRVIRALEAYFTARGEPYRFVLLGPTGTASALIGGSTYHSFLGLRTGKFTGESRATVEDLRERLLRVGYIFIDECSMLSCLDLCRISARICEALNVYEKPFGGLNMILAGDFAQLPPTGGRGNELYSRDIPLHQTPRQSVQEQEKTIGKLIWLQFNTVVILQENMRQKGTSPQEKAFQQALENLRWQSCTDADIALLRTRIAGKTSGSCLDTDPFKNISIITTFNKVKDEFNAYNSLRFAKECGQQLTDFYSVDKLADGEPKRKRGRSAYTDVRAISHTLRQTLWNQPPNTSEQIPGCLKLCLGMPVLIRYNVATDLCITRGQEARVVGWTSQTIGQMPGRRRLDVLYLELTKPPKKVKLPNLPVNVVPLTAIDHYIEARLPSDSKIKIKRTQVPILPNFAMTDYSSQGKTRPVNVVDIAESRSFQGVYTSLSRGTSLAGTLILRHFDNDNLQGGVDGAIRQEYRELDYLATITDLIYQGIVEPDFALASRWATIDKWRRWKRSCQGPSPEPTDGDDLNMPHFASVRPEIHTLDALKKRKLSEQHVSSRKKKKLGKLSSLLMEAPWIVPVGPIWDGRDYSCAYDALTFSFYWLWFSDQERWSVELRSYSPMMTVIVRLFEEMNVENIRDEVTGVREEWRVQLRAAFPGEYPPGTIGADLLSVARRILGIQERSDRPPDQLIRYSVCQLASVQDHFDSCEAVFSLATREVMLLCVEMASCPDVMVNLRIRVGQGMEFRLTSVIYFGEFHFVSRVITPDNMVYMHDGIDGCFSTFEGCIGEDLVVGDLSSCGQRLPTIALYVAD